MRRLGFDPLIFYYHARCEAWKFIFEVYARNLTFALAPAIKQSLKHEPDTERTLRTTTLRLSVVPDILALWSQISVTLMC